MDDETAKPGLDESLLGTVLPRWPGGISRPSPGLGYAPKPVSPKSPQERARWLDELLALNAPLPEE